MATTSEEMRRRIRRRGQPRFQPASAAAQPAAAEAATNEGIRRRIKQGSQPRFQPAAQPAAAAAAAAPSAVADGPGYRSAAEARQGSATARATNTAVEAARNSGGIIDRAKRFASKAGRRIARYPLYEEGARLGYDAITKSRITPGGFLYQAGKAALDDDPNTTISGVARGAVDDFGRLIRGDVRGLTGGQQPSSAVLAGIDSAARGEGLDNTVRTVAERNFLTSNLVSPGAEVPGQTPQGDSVTDQAAADPTLARIQQRDAAVDAITSRVQRGLGTSPYGDPVSGEPGLPRGTGVIIGPNGQRSVIDAGPQGERQTVRPQRINRQSNGGLTRPRADVLNFAAPTIQGATGILNQRLQNEANATGQSAAERRASQTAIERDRLDLDAAEFDADQREALFNRLNDENPTVAQSARDQVYTEALQGSGAANTLARANLGQTLADIADDTTIFGDTNFYKRLSDWAAGRGGVGAAGLGGSFRDFAISDSGTIIAANGKTIGNINDVAERAGPQAATLLRKLIADDKGSVAPTQAERLRRGG